jgi:UMF1 family MFS transporter
MEIRNKPHPASGPTASAAWPAIAGWVLFEWATQPFFTLITTFVYAPYFAAAIAPDPARGQALWGFATSGAALAIAALAPILGAIADAAGRRKPWIFAFSALAVAASAALWFGLPGHPETIGPVLAAFGLGAVGAQCAFVFSNAMMPTLVPHARLGVLSGTGWAVGYTGGLVSLVICLGFLIASPQSGHTLFGFAPLFGLDPATHAGDRASGPLTAVWLVIFALPLFLFTPDQPRKLKLREAVRRGIATLADTLTHLPRYRNATLFLIANMIYADGLVALFAFGGIYAAGTFGWSTIEIGLFGIMLTVTGAVGALIGGRLDDRFGSKPVIAGALVILILAALAILTIDRDRIAFVAVAPPAPGHGLFAGAAERAYVLIGLFIGLVVGPMQAASRTLLARLAPPERLTQFFGLYALSARVTSFVSPFLVAVVTAATGSQKAGMAVLVLFFVAGLAVLSRVRA